MVTDGGRGVESIVNPDWLTILTVPDVL